ncbi:hypothetical protein KEM55_001021 [Ascosphaera atra]|nr:hypothetical protein KEM55_001021 [Ascosphaera atra]
MGRPKPSPYEVPRVTRRQALAMQQQALTSEQSPGDDPVTINEQSGPPNVTSDHSLHVHQAVETECHKPITDQVVADRTLAADSGPQDPPQVPQQIHTQSPQVSAVDECVEEPLSSDHFNELSSFNGISPPESLASDPLSPGRNYTALLRERDLLRARLSNQEAVQGSPAQPVNGDSHVHQSPVSTGVDPVTHNHAVDAPSAPGGSPSDSSSSSSETSPVSSTRSRPHKRRRRHHHRHGRHRRRSRSPSSPPSTDILSSTSRNPRPEKYSKKGQHPSAKLRDADGFNQWEFAINLKFGDDAPFFPSDSYKVNYALTQTEGPLFDNLVSWVKARKSSRASFTWKSFLREIHSYLGITFIVAESKINLERVRQDSKESVSDLFNKMSVWWQHAETPVRECIRQLRQALAPYLHTALSAIDDDDFTDERELLNKARAIEHRRKETRVLYPNYGNFRSQSSNRSFSRNRSSSRPSGQSTTPATYVNSSTFSGPPCAQKPSGWVGRWFDPIPNPPPLSSQAERDQLRVSGSASAMA